MPNAKVLEEKKKTVLEMTERLKSKSGVFVDYRGITGVEETAMRAELRKANVDYSVIKNRLMKFAIKNAGFDELESQLTGTTSLATSNDDPIAPARTIKEFADKMPDYFEIKAGFMDGRILSKSEVLAIASIPPLPVLQAQFLGTLLAPISKLAVVIKAIAEKDGASTEPAEVKAEKPVPDKGSDESKTDEVKAEEPVTEIAPAAETATETATEPETAEDSAAETSPAEGNPEEAAAAEEKTED